jgi:uncharacterized membrane protein YqjE
VTAQPPDPNSVRGLLSLLLGQVSELARLYAAAARQEVEEGLEHLKVGSLLAGVALSFLAVAAMVLVLLLVAAISALTGLLLWAAALIVLVIVLLLAALFGWLAVRRFQRARLMPDETIAAAKEDLEWAQHWTKRG